MVHDKINMWKKELDIGTANGLHKTKNTVTQYPTTSHAGSSGDRMPVSNTHFLKQEDDLDDDEEEDSYSYGNDCFSNKAISSKAPLTTQ